MEGRRNGECEAADHLATRKTSLVTGDIRHDWSAAEIRAIYDLPLLELLQHAQIVHRLYHNPTDIQRASLLSIKTGNCPEDCAYCPQSAHWKQARTKREPLLSVDAVLLHARQAKAAGAQRFCMGAAWREVKDGPDFESVLNMVRAVRELGLEACATLGMLTEHQAKRLADAGLTAYNHNLDSGPQFYKTIISTRSYEDRLRTIHAARKAGIEICSGGIIGLGESVDDRVALLQVLAGLDPHPESVPINALVAVPGTPLERQPPVDALDLVRMCATTRIVVPRARVRLSAGRRSLNREAQLLCFVAGANSIFYGDTLLTTPNCAPEEDRELLAAAGVSTSVD
jgi:biotin synthase